MKCDKRIKNPNRYCRYINGEMCLKQSEFLCIDAVRINERLKEMSKKKRDAKKSKKKRTHNQIRREKYEKMAKGRKGGQDASN